MTETKISLLQSYFLKNDMLLCNENKDLPSLTTVGGDWDSIIMLIEQGEVFYSKFYKGRVTYLSREFYYKVKPDKQRTHKLTAKAREVLELIEAANPVSTSAIKDKLMISSKEYTACMDELFKELLVTAIKRDRTINANWSSFCWGTSQHWERLFPGIRRS